MITVKPILRIFDLSKALEFYIDWLEFQIDWQHGQEHEPKYLQVSLSNIVLHLSEHHGDGTPGTRIFVDGFEDLVTFHKKLLEKNYKYNKPGLDIPFYDDRALQVQVDDPFGNKLIFVERNVR